MTLNIVFTEHYMYESANLACLIMSCQLLYNQERKDFRNQKKQITNE